MEKMTSEGICIFCKKSYSKAGISRHLASHLKAIDKVAKKKSYHLKVEAGPYFLQLLIDGNASLDELDSFLRAIWLECCGHLSQFSFGRWNDELDFDMVARKLFGKGVQLWYAYDFGSTTELNIKCMGEYPIATPEGIRLLSRNNPLDIPCDTCKKKAAVELCSVHWDGSDMYFCKKCTKKHSKTCADAEYAMLPIVNSPRMGVCAYEGGTFDVERD